MRKLTYNIPSFVELPWVRPAMRGKRTVYFTAKASAGKVLLLPSKYIGPSRRGTALETSPVPYALFYGYVYVQALPSHASFHLVSGRRNDA